MRAVVHAGEALLVGGPGSAGRVPHAAAPLEREGEGGERERQQREEEQHPRGEGRGAPGGGGGGAAVARHGIGSRPAGRWLPVTRNRLTTTSWPQWAEHYTGWAYYVRMAGWTCWAC